MKEVEYKGYDCIEFDMKITMRTRWVPHFLAMLKYMERLGSVGASRTVSFFADGDGDFRPKFEFDEELKVKEQDMQDFKDRFYDAG